MTRPGLVTSLFLGAVILAGIVLAGFGLTPSSYGLVLTHLGAPEAGPIIGSPRDIRFDEWAAATPLFQAAVRNGFRRINETSFYREDLRNFYLLPVKDWSLAFKPELWAFFVGPPATAFSIYYVLLMWAFLVGYFILFRQLALAPYISAAAALLLFFCGFTQFWWTTFGGLLAGLPWILNVLFAPLRWWWKAALFSWVIPVVCFSFVYPTFFAEFAFAGVVLVAAIRPSLFRSPKELAALSIGGLITGVLLFVYFQDLIPIMRHTWYPGKRLGLPGTTDAVVVLSQFFPFLAFSMDDFMNLNSVNICESATVGSFLPLLTLCLISPRGLWANRILRGGLIAIAGAVALIMFWQMTPAPRRLGHLLLWDHGNAERLFFIEGLLITVGCLLVWRADVLSPGRLRIAIFVVLGPLLGFAAKLAVFHLPLSGCLIDLALAALAAFAGVIACMAPKTVRLPLLLGTVTLMNVVTFGRFNPLQPAGPIFDVPETPILQQLRQTEESTPGHFLISQSPGAVQNGLGFRSVPHTLMAPSLTVYRKYFPAMDAARFDFIFNRYAHIAVTSEPVPRVTEAFILSLPSEAFEPPRHVRTATLEVASHKDCAIPRGGNIDRVNAQANQLTIEGWAPWKAEDATQELRVTTARTLEVRSLLTVKRPDVSEAMNDYAYTRSGFQLQLSSADGTPIHPEEVVLAARGTSQGLIQLTGCGCPK